MDLVNSSEVIGFDSTVSLNADKNVMVKDSSTDPIEDNVEVSHKYSTTTEKSEKETQTTSSIVFTSNSSEEEDKKLAEWLRKILPALEKELEDQQISLATPESEKKLKFELYQEIEVSGSSVSKGNATWLSVLTQNCSLLALSHYQESDQSFVSIYEPRRCKHEGKIIWYQLETFPVKESIDFFATNFQNRDMFAGATKNGDLYVWLHRDLYRTKSSGESRVVELFSKVTDSVVALSFLSDNRLLLCHKNDGKMTLYKILNTQNLVVDKTMKIEARNLPELEISCVASLPGDEFIVGLTSGNIFICTTNEIVPQEGPFNPMKRELQAHQFAVKNIKYCQNNGKSFIVTCDISSEVFIFDFNDDSEKQPKYVIKLPLPIKSTITCRNDIKHLISLDKDSLEVFATSTKEKEIVIQEPSETSGSFIEISPNDSWLVSGLHNGKFKIYSLDIEN